MAETSDAGQEAARRRSRADPAAPRLRADLCFLMLPLLVLFPISFSSGSYLRFPPPGFSLKWYARYFDDPTWIDAT